MLKKIVKLFVTKIGRKLLRIDFIAIPTKQLLYNYPSLFSRLQILIVTKTDKDRTYHSPRASIVYKDLLEEIKKSQEKNNANFN